MSEYDNSTRAALERARCEAQNEKIKNLSKQEFDLVTDLIGKGIYSDGVSEVVEEFQRMENTRPSQWLQEKEFVKVFVPEQYRESYFYIVDKLNQFPFSSGWHRRTVRSANYRFSIRYAFSILLAYDKFANSGVSVADYIYKRLNAEMADYIKHSWNYEHQFSYIYAAEIDRGNQQVIDALKDLILSETNSAYLDRQMILGILRSDNAQLQKLLGDFLLAARLQEGVRQSICEAMDAGTTQAFLTLLDVIEKNNLIRYSSIKRAVSTWIGIFDENNVDRVSNKLLELMGQCLRDKAFCQEQLKTNDSLAISVALWALGFEEVDDAVKAMEELITHGTKNQKLTVSYYNKTLYSGQLQRRIAKKVILEQYDDLELVTAFLSIYSEYVVIWVRELLSQGSASVSKKEEPLKPELTDYYVNRTEAEKLYEIFSGIYERLPKKGLIYDPCIFPWYRVELSRADVIRQLAFLAYVLQDEEKITQAASLLSEMSGGIGRSNLIKLLLYEPKNQKQREILIKAMGITEEYTSKTAVSLVKRMHLEREDY